MCTLQELQCSVELTLFWGSEIHLQFLFDPGFQSFLNPKFVCNCPENYVCLLQDGFSEQALHSWISRRCSGNLPQVWQDTWKARMNQQIPVFLLLLENISLTALVNKINNLNLNFNLGSL